jgi:hypothetical protein
MNKLNNYDDWQIIKPEFEIYVPPTPIGCYRLGKHTMNCTKFPMYYKPKRIHRFFMRVLLGWYWEDNSEK